MEAGSPVSKAIIDHFDDPEDLRIDRRKLHKLTDIVIIAICAVICGAETWEDLEEFGKSKQDWFERLLELSNGIPSHDTFARVFIRLDPQKFGQCFVTWIRAVSQGVHGLGVDIVSLDGATLRRPFDTALGKTPLHMVNAWSTNCGIALGQVAVDEKSNEITAIPELLDLLDISGCIVTADALNTQRTIAEKVMSHQADYVLALKGNQGSLHADVELKFDQMEHGLLTKCTSDHHQTVDADHGRLETRNYWITDDIDFLKDHKWPGLASIGITATMLEYSEGKVSR